MRVTLGKNYKCVREFNAAKELDIWTVTNIMNNTVILKRGGITLGMDKRVMSVYFERVK